MVYSKLKQWLSHGISEFGYIVILLLESLYWIVLGRFKSQAVSIRAIFFYMVQIGINALPIISVLSLTIGVMLAMQGIHTLRVLGAESKVILGLVLSVTREFAPLIIGIVVAGRSGSALTAKIGTMQVSQEIDALRVIGINPVRYLVSPVLVAVFLMLPALTFYADVLGILGGILYSSTELNHSVQVYILEALDLLSLDDVLHGLWKSMVFAVIITLVGVSNGFMVQGGAEEVGTATTRSVVFAITYIIIADMIFTFYLSHE